MSLTNASVSTLVSMNGTDCNPSFQPIVQVLSTRAVGKAGGERYRLILSDGQYFINGLLSTQLNNLVLDGQIAPNSFIKITKFLNNYVNEKHVIVCLNVEVVGTNPGSRIGNPTDYETSKPSTSAPPQGGVGGVGQPLYNKTNAYDNNNPAMRKAPNPYVGGGGSSNSYGASNSGAVSSNPYVGNNRFQPNTNIVSSAPIVRSDPGHSNFTPIASLNMYQNKWTIKACVVSKSQIRTWSNAKGDGSLFSIEILDNSMDIRATFFKEAVDKFYNMLEEGKTYTFSGGRLKVANMQYNTCKSNFEMTFDQNSEIHLVHDNSSISKANLYDFTKIVDIENKEANAFVDLLALVKTVADPVTIVSRKSGQELTKCELTLIDESGCEIQLTLWGEKALHAQQEYRNTPVVAFRRARVSDYGGKTLSLSGSADINPVNDLPSEVNALQIWWNNYGNSMLSAKSLSTSMGMGKVEPLASRKGISSIKEENLGNSDKPDWISFKGTVSFLKKDKEGGAWYPACANAGEPCKNRYKVTQTTDGQWYCDKCSSSYVTCCRRWIFSGTVEDDTSSTWVSFFNEQAETLLNGATADDVYNQTFAMDNSDQDQYDSYFAKAQYSEWIFKCKVKMEMVNEESRVKASVYTMHPIDYVKESRDLLQEIEKF